MQYKKISPLIVVEKYLDNGNGKLDDYKVYCFNGVPKFVMICVGRQFGKPKFYFFYRGWQFQRINKDGPNENMDFSLPKPKNVEEMFIAAEILSKPFPFVRVDFYLVNNAVVFGEMTFTPAGGQDSNVLPTMDQLFGDMVEI